MDDLYPVTIIPARYSGTYEGAPWLAFYAEPAWVDSSAVQDDDVSCSNWWHKHGNDPRIGRGGTPQEAYEALAAKCDSTMNAFGEGFEEI